MSNIPVIKEFFLQPGTIIVPSKPTKIFSVVGSGVIVAIWEKRLKRGGLCHFTKPIREDKSIVSYKFALPSILGVISHLEKSGGKVIHMEASVFGGSEKFGAKNYKPLLGKKNVDTAIEILNRKNIEIVTNDTGSNRGRKVMFNSETGESIVAKVNSLREDDWYFQ